MLVGVDADVAPVALAAAAAVGIGGGGVVAAVSAVLGGGPLAGAVVGAVVDIRGAVSYSYGRLTDSTGCEIDWKCERGTKTKHQLGRNIECEQEPILDEHA